MRYFYLFFILISNLEAQNNFDFYGVISLNGKMDKSISYHLVFTEKNGVINGYSLTDVSGDHETKNIVEGTYDAKSRALQFKEKSIIYTKSPISQESFCFINYSGKIKLKSTTTNLNGNFKGFFNNNSPCIDGTLNLFGAAKVYELLAKIDKKIQKSKRVDAETKQKARPVQIFDSLQVNKLTSKQNLNIFNSNDNIKFDIWDNGKEDGDIINLYQNDKLILENYNLTKAKKSLAVKLDPKENIFKIVALNEGTDFPNTAMIEFQGDSKVELVSHLKKGESAFITILNKKI